MPPINIVEEFAAPPVEGPVIATVNRALVETVLTRWKRGVSFTLKIVEGEHAGRLVRVELLYQGSENLNRVEHDAGVIRQWLAVSGVKQARDFPQLVELLAASTHKVRTQFVLSRQQRTGAVETFISGVDKAPEPETAAANVSEDGPPVTETDASEYPF